MNSYLPLEKELYSIIFQNRKFRRDIHCHRLKLRFPWCWGRLDKTAGLEEEEEEWEEERGEKEKREVEKEEEKGK